MVSIDVNFANRSGFYVYSREALGCKVQGTYAEHIRLPPRFFSHVPTAFSFFEAAAFPLVFITLWRMLITKAQLQPGEPCLSSVRRWSCQRIPTKLPKKSART